MQSILIRLIKEPLIQFLVIGACIYGAYALYGAPQEDIAGRRIIVDQARILDFASQWEARWNRPPTRQELDAVIRSYVRENILFRQALAMGLGEDDPITRRRLAQKLEFLTNDVALIQEPDAGELEQYFQDYQELYREPDLITFSQVFIDPDRHEESALEYAAELLAELQAAGEPDTATLDIGDRLMLQNYYPEFSESGISRQFGPGFSTAVMQLEPGQWYGPVLSGYGVHLVYVHALKRALPTTFEDVRQSVLENWQSEQRKKFNAEFFDSLKSSYEIVIAEVPAELLLDTGIETNAGAEQGIEAVTEAGPIS